MYYKTTIIKTVLLDHEQSKRTIKFMSIQGKIKVALQITGERMGYLINLINLVDTITNVGEEKQIILDNSQ